MSWVIKKNSTSIIIITHINTKLYFYQKKKKPQSYTTIRVINGILSHIPAFSKGEFSGYLLAMKVFDFKEIEAS